MAHRTLRRRFALARRRMVYRVSFAIFKLLRFVPAPLLHKLGEAAAGLAYHVLRRERRYMRRNLLAAFPEKTQAEHDAIAWGVFRNVARHVVQVLLAWRRGRVREAPDLPSRADWDELRAKVLEKGAIVITAHLGAWEILGCGFAQHAPGRLGVLAHRLRFAPANEWAERLRNLFGVRVFYNDAPLLAAVRYLKDKNVLGILPDQDLKHVPGTFVPFFGRPAWTPVGPAVLALASGVPAYCIYCLWIDGAYRLLSEGPLPLPATGDRDEDIRIFTETWTGVLERVIRTYPDQWVWFHRRWRTTPRTLALLRARNRTP
ncbi:MAG TPA: hypothetical protein PKX48_08095 [Planctomycetota bacterium]|nr:hypothetical protein [Planctomycetota bacterium]OQC21156.1 MAG: Lipid A biosynthesis lauroyl acyltransferase [Planctomycetes bacterium ADurb.Bin069]NMD36308.1 hypothetical protein [Planctomycetota bacterium]HNR99765.1 hypothetical protein [Planctomycetota bacterium]HNU27220.1 hypothetical protein [Planctomycetota bacterium]